MLVVGSDGEGDGGACYAQSSGEIGRHHAPPSIHQSLDEGRIHQGGLGFVYGPIALEVIAEAVAVALDEAQEDDECGVCLGRVGH